jgi:glycosyltransferase involved in cell wall biosynthesis
MTREGRGRADQEAALTQPADPPLVSVVLIFLNAERFLREAVESVRGQTYPAWELWLVDDGSSDASTEIAKGYAESDPERIHYVEHAGHRNLGMSASRNLGISRSRGRYVAPLDADDVWLPEKLERQVAILEEHPQAALLFGAPLYWSGWTGRPEDDAEDYVIDLRLPTNRVYDPPELLVRFLRLTAPPPCPSDVLVRREAADSVGGFEDSFRGMYEDQAFFSKLLLRFPAYVSGETWDRYRQHESSCYAVAKATGARSTARRGFLTWLRGRIVEQGLTSGPVWQAVRDELRPFSLRGRMILRGKWLARRLLPDTVRARVGAHLPGAGPKRVRFGSLRRLQPVSRNFGWDRGGLPVDRYYIDDFLARHADDVSGRVLEVKDAAYTRRFGGDRVERSDVLHPVPGNPEATIVADLAESNGSALPTDAFDCVILTQVLPFIPDVPAALRTVHRLLRPGGVVLATVPGISQIVRRDMDAWGDYWRFTSLSARRLFEEAFSDGAVEVEAFGNVLAATAFLYGLSSDELRPEERDHFDPDYEVLIAIRAVKETRDV